MRQALGTILLPQHTWNRSENDFCLLRARPRAYKHGFEDDVRHSFVGLYGTTSDVSFEPNPKNFDETRSVSESHGSPPGTLPQPTHLLFLKEDARTAVAAELNEHAINHQPI